MTSETMAFPSPNPLRIMKMFVAAAGSAHSQRNFGFSLAVTVCKQILNAMMYHAAVASDRSRFAVLSQRYLDDVGMTASDRAAALGYEEPMLDGWRVVASHL